MEIEYKTDHHTLLIGYDITPSERDVGINGGVEIESVSISYKERERELNMEKMTDDYLMHLTDYVEGEI